MSFGNNRIVYREFVHCIDQRAEYLAIRYSKCEKVIIKNINPINTIIKFFGMFTSWIGGCSYKFQNNSIKDGFNS